MDLIPSTYRPLLVISPRFLAAIHVEPIVYTHKLGPAGRRRRMKRRKLDDPSDIEAFHAALMRSACSPPCMPSAVSDGAIAEA